MPVSVGVKTSCPARCRSFATGRQNHAPSQPPCTSTYVAIDFRLPLIFLESYVFIVLRPAPDV